MDVRLSNSGVYNNNSADYNVKSAAKSSEVIGNDKINTTSQLKKMENDGIVVSTSEEQVVKALDRVLKAMEGPSTTLEVSVHKETKAIMVKVLNKETGELIRELPPEKTLDIVANMMKIAGIIIDEKV